MTQTVGPHEVPELLDNVFGIRTDPGEARLLETRLRELDSAQHRPGPTPKADLIGRPVTCPLSPAQSPCQRRS